jgi:signal transduction histidine kinase
MGLGVGLSICYGIIEDHQGTITAENSPDGGVVFTISLPLGQVA